MGQRLPQVTSKEVMRALERLGFVVRRQTGSHIILRHPISHNIATVPFHNRDIKRGLLFGIIKQAGITQQDFLSAL